MTNTPEEQRMSGSLATPFITPRAMALYGLICDAAEAGAITPKGGALLEALRELGHDSGRTGQAITRDLDLLESAGMVRRAGCQQFRILEVVATGRQTVARPRKALTDEQKRRRNEDARKRKAIATALAAVPAVDPACSGYDAAVARREFALHEIGVPAAQAPRVHGSALHPVAMYSLTGNAAAMCAP